MDQQKENRKRRCYDSPVELVWRALTGDKSSQLVTPMEEDEYSARPAPGTVFTRSLGCEVNERLAFEIKTHQCTSLWEIRLFPIDSCKTEVSVRLTNDYAGAAAFFLCYFSRHPDAEIHRFFKDLDRRLHDLERKLKLY